MKEKQELSQNLDKYLKCNLHKKQMEFHKNPSRNRWVFGGNRTGKTECGAVEAVLWATGVHPWRKISRPVEGWVVSLTRQMSREIAQAKILKYLDQNQIAEIVMYSGRKDSPEYGVIDFIMVRTADGNLSKISFKTCEQGREKFQGTGLDFVWFDEEPPQDIYEECLVRTLDREDSCVWATMTPLKGKTWVYDKVYLDQSGQISTLSMSWEDNPYLLPAEIRKMQAALSEDALESRKFGRFMEGTGLVFREFSEANIVDPFDVPKSWYTCISIDPGYTNPTAALWIVVDADENIFVVADYAVVMQAIPFHARKIIEISGRLGFEKDPDGFLPAIIDSAALARSVGSEKSAVEQFIENGIRVNPKVDKGVIEGIMKLKGLFKNVDGVRKLFVFKNCTYLVKELKDYWWGDNERPVKKGDHCIDALRYFVSTLYENREACAIIPAQKPKNLLWKAKQKIIRDAKGVL